MTDIQIRDLHTIDEFRQVVDLEREIWGYTDNAEWWRPGASTVHRGASSLAVEPLGACGLRLRRRGMKAGKRCCGPHDRRAAWHRGGLGYRLKIESALAPSRRLRPDRWPFDREGDETHISTLRSGGVVENTGNFYANRPARSPWHPDR